MHVIFNDFEFFYSFIRLWINLAGNLPSQCLWYSAFGLFVDINGIKFLCLLMVGRLELCFSAVIAFIQFFFMKQNMNYLFSMQILEIAIYFHTKKIWGLVTVELMSGAIWLELLIDCIGKLCSWSISLIHLQEYELLYIKIQLCLIHNK